MALRAWQVPSISGKLSPLARGWIRAQARLGMCCSPREHPAPSCCSGCTLPAGSGLLLLLQGEGFFQLQVEPAGNSVCHRGAVAALHPQIPH